MSSITTRFVPRLYWRFNASFVTNSKTVMMSLPKLTQPEHLATSTPKITEGQHIKFEDLKETLHKSISLDSSIASKIKNSQNVFELLDLIKMSNLSKTDILNIMRTIISWVNKNHTNATDIDTNTENIKDVSSLICIKDKEMDDFSNYVDLSTSAMVILIYEMARHKRRDVKLLNFLLEHINQYNMTLSIRQCSSLLFSMSTLSCFNQALIEKICSILIQNVNTISPQVNSIIRSMALLKYKNTDFLNHLCKLLCNPKIETSNTYILNILRSLSILNYETKETNMVIKRYLPNLLDSKLTHDDWLNLVWSLLILNNLSKSYAESVLKKDFIENFKSSDSTYLQKQIQLLNINGAAQYILQDYNGQLLDKSVVPNVTNKVTKQKTLYINALEETLKSFLKPSQFKINVNTNMGFLLDAECHMKHNFEPVSNNDTNVKKIAIVIHTYNDFCKGATDFIGKIKLQNSLLLHSGYRVLNISYQQFGFQDQLYKRSEFLKHRLRSLK